MNSRSSSHRNFRTWVFLSLALFYPQTVAADNPTELVIVVNRKQPDSLALANQYINDRRIPPSHVIYVDFDLKQETTNISVFKEKVLLPVLKTIRDRKLEQQISYVVYSSGFPTRITEKKHLEKYLKKSGQKYQIQLHAPWCSINALTYFYQRVLKDDLSFFEFDSNRYFRKPIANYLEKPFVGKHQLSYESALKKMRPGQYDAAIKMLQRLAASAPGQPVVRYQIARCYAFDNKPSLAVNELIKAVESGWSYRAHTVDDNAFHSLRETTAFKKALNLMPDERLGMLPTRKFSHQVNWTKQGWPAALDEVGERYLLSTVLGVSQSIGGTATVSENLAQIKRTVKADGTRPDGTFFFAKHNDIRSKTRAPQFDLAVNAIKKLGFKAAIIKSTVPENALVNGATLGSPKIPWQKSGSSFAPGAICDNFTSYGGWFEKKQTHITDYIKFGAGGASGSVYEPYAIPPKFPHAMIQVHYARGSTLGEAFYQSIASPRYMLIVGDPLCRPFAKLPEFDVKGLENGQTVKESITITARPTGEGPTVKKFKMYMDGQQIAEIKPNEPFEIATKTLSSGFHELRVVGVADTLIGAVHSKILSFDVEQGQQKIELTRATSGPIKLSESVTIRAQTNVGKRIAIVQNSRVVAEIQGTSGKATIPAALLGRGISHLRAVAVYQSQKISSRPLKVEVNP